MPAPGYIPLKDRKPSGKPLIPAAVPKKIIKVGLDEWVMVKREDEVSLCTDGLIGCVGLVLTNSSHALLSHIFSDCSDANWNEYETALNQARNAITKRGALTGATLVVSNAEPNAAAAANGPAIEKAGFLWLQHKLAAWLGNAPPIQKIYSSPGMQVSPLNGGWDVMRKNEFQASLYTEAPNSLDADSKKLISEKGMLSKAGRASNDDS